MMLIAAVEDLAATTRVLSASLATISRAIDTVGEDERLSHRAEQTGAQDVPQELYAAALARRPGQLQPCQLRILCYMVERAGEFINHAEIMGIASQRGAGLYTVKVQISNIRTTLGAFGLKDAIVTGRKSYCLSEEAVPGVMDFLLYG